MSLGSGGDVDLRPPFDRLSSSDSSSSSVLGSLAGPRASFSPLSMPSTATAAGDGPERGHRYSCTYSSTFPSSSFVQNPDVPNVGENGSNFLLVGNNRRPNCSAEFGIAGDDASVPSQTIDQSRRFSDGSNFHHSDNSNDCASNMHEKIDLKVDSRPQVQFNNVGHHAAAPNPQLPNSCGYQSLPPPNCSSISSHAISSSLPSSHIESMPTVNVGTFRPPGFVPGKGSVGSPAQQPISSGFSPYPGRAQAHKVENLPINNFPPAMGRQFAPRVVSHVDSSCTVQSPNLSSTSYSSHPQPDSITQVGSSSFTASASPHHRVFSSPSVGNSCALSGLGRSGFQLQSASSSLANGTGQIQFHSFPAAHSACFSAPRDQNCPHDSDSSAFSPVCSNNLEKNISRIPPVQPPPLQALPLSSVAVSPPVFPSHSPSTLPLSSLSTPCVVPTLGSAGPVKTMPSSSVVDVNSTPPCCFSSPSIQGNRFAESVSIRDKTDSGLTTLQSISNIPCAANSWYPAPMLPFAPGFAVPSHPALPIPPSTAFPQMNQPHFHTQVPSHQHLQVFDQSMQNGFQYQHPQQSQVLHQSQSFSQHQPQQHFHHHQHQQQQHQQQQQQQGQQFQQPHVPWLPTEFQKRGFVDPNLQSQSQMLKPQQQTFQQRYFSSQVPLMGNSQLSGGLNSGERVENLSSLSSIHSSSSSGSTVFSVPPAMVLDRTRPFSNSQNAEVSSFSSFPPSTSLSSSSVIAVPTAIGGSVPIVPACFDGPKNINLANDKNSSSVQNRTVFQKTGTTSADYSDLFGYSGVSQPQTGPGSRLGVAVGSVGSNCVTSASSAPATTAGSSVANPYSNRLEKCLKSNHLPDLSPLSPSASSSLSSARVSSTSQVRGCGETGSNNCNASTTSPRHREESCSDSISGSDFDDDLSNESSEVDDPTPGLVINRQWSSSDPAALPPELEKQIIEIDPSFRDTEAHQQWLREFNALFRFYCLFGHSRVHEHALQCPQYEQLSEWCAEQRRRHRSRSLHRVMFFLLQAIRLELRGSSRWMKYYKILRHNHEKYGVCILSRSNRAEKGRVVIEEPNDVDRTDLRSWINAQRKRWKIGSLDDKQKRLLSEINFIWEPDRSKWMTMFQQLQTFRAEFGNCDVPQRFAMNPALGAWVNSQRKNYKKGSLPADKIKILEDTGFRWTVKK